MTGAGSWSLIVRPVHDGGVGTAMRQANGARSVAIAQSRLGSDRLGEAAGDYGCSEQRRMVHNPSRRHVDPRAPYVESIVVNGVGVFETLKHVAKLVLKALS